MDKDYFLEADKYLEMYLDKKKSFQPDQFPRYGTSEAGSQTSLTMREIEDLQAKRTFSDSDLLINLFQKSPDLFPKIYSKFVYEGIVFDRRNLTPTEILSSARDIPLGKEPKSTDTFSLSKSRKNRAKKTFPPENNLSFTSQKILDLDLSMNNNNNTGVNFTKNFAQNQRGANYHLNQNPILPSLTDVEDKEKMISRKRKKSFEQLRLQQKRHDL